MNTKEKTLTDLVNELGITAKVTPLNKIPTSNTWARQAWRITLKYDGRTMGFNFYGGGAVTSPGVDDGVWCQALESYGVAGNSFEEWCGEFGYSTDSRESFKTYQTLKRNAARFSEFIGSDPLIEQLYVAAVNY